MLAAAQIQIRWIAHRHGWLTFYPSWVCWPGHQLAVSDQPHCSCHRRGPAPWKPYPVSPLPKQIHHLLNAWFQKIGTRWTMRNRKIFEFTSTAVKKTMRVEFYFSIIRLDRIAEHVLEDSFCGVIMIIGLSREWASEWVNVWASEWLSEWVWRYHTSNYRGK